VCFADGGDLFEVMPAVHKLEHAPLVDIKWTEDGVARELVRWAEEGFGFAHQQVETSEVFRCGMGEAFAGE
jgi:hypothetical protein